MKILSILGADQATIEKNDIKRKARAMERGQNALIDKIEAEVDDLVSKKEKLESVTVKTVNEKTWAEEYQSAKVDVLMKKKELELAKDTLLEFFTEQAMKESPQH